ncbi:hypothetical protein SASPL_156237 [Salvia splendens]|uniref:Germin-like protein n=1 Tax=Salvia splendens TaxID=180675 RepID=A0A8X8VXD2_SALSN|nr:hypothetical protein SASPL_156237 [Salvia splendens]
MNLILTLSFVAIIWPSLVLGHEPSPLQDFCVADFNSIVRVNGFPCLNPKQVTVDHFLFKGLNIVGNTSNYLGVSVNRPTVNEIPGLNTLGMSTVRVDYAISGVVPPHRHPRASEILVVLEGTVLVDLSHQAPKTSSFQKCWRRAMFSYFLWLFHFQQNVGSGNAITMAFLNSQNPGVVIAANAMFGSSPRIDADVLDRALEVDSSVIEKPYLIYKGSNFNFSELNFPLHADTHVDAPGHFYENYFEQGFDADTLDLIVLNGPELLVDVLRDENITGMCAWNG